MEPPTWSIISASPTTPLFYFHDHSSSSTPSQPKVATHSDHGHSNVFAGEYEHGDDGFSGEGFPVGDDEFGGAESYVGDHDTFNDESGRGHFVSSLSDSMHTLMFAPSLLKSFSRNLTKSVNDSPIM